MSKPNRLANASSRRHRKSKLNKLFRRQLQFEAMESRQLMCTTPPVVTLGGSDVTFTEDGAAINVAPSATVNYACQAGGTVVGDIRVQLTGNASQSDRLTISPGGNVSIVQGNVIRYPDQFGFPVAIGNFAGGEGATPLVFTITNGIVTPAMVQDVLRHVTFQSLGNNPSTASRTAQVQLIQRDPDLNGNTANRQINVTAVNDRSVLALPSGIVSHAPGGGPTVIDSQAEVADIDSLDFNGGNLSARLVAGSASDDRLSIRHQGTGAGQIGISGNTVQFGGTSIGTFSGGSGSTALSISLNASANIAATRALLRNITFEATAASPTTGRRTVEFTLSDGDGGTSRAARQFIRIGTANFDGFAAYQATSAVTSTPPKYVELGDFDNDGNDSLIAGNFSGRPQAADFNADGNLDLLKFDNFQVKLALGNGAGGFAADQTIQSLTTESFAIGDFDGDGILDVAVAHHVDSSALAVSILINNGQGSFAARQQLPLSSEGLASAVGDVNGDSFADVLIGQQNGVLRLFLGRGDGTFAAGQDVNRQSSTGYRGLTLADFNSDRLADIAVADASANRVWVGVNNGQVAFNFQSYTTSLGVTDLDVGDVNRDGKLDIVTAELGAANGNNPRGGKVSFLSGNGTGGFAAAVSFNAGPQADAKTLPYDVALGDLNADGLPDIAVGHASNQNCFVDPFSGNTFCNGVTSLQATTLTALNSQTQTAQPEITVVGYSPSNPTQLITIPDGSATPATANFTFFGYQAVAGGSTTQNFGILNTGPGQLQLTGNPKIRIVGDHTADFTVVEPQPTSPINTGSSRTFQITFDPRESGVRTARVEIDNNDIDEGLYDFVIQGIGTPFVVNTLSDSNGICTEDECSLREAIGLANVWGNQDTVTFAPGLTGTIQLTGALPNLTTPITIQGPGADVLTIRRNTGGDYRIFTVSDGGNATISGFSITNGIADLGGGILNNQSALVLTDSKVFGNRATTGLANGGGVNTIATNGQATTTIRRTYIFDNQADREGGGLGSMTFGTGTATTNIFDSTISNNTANNVGGGIAQFAQFGGTATVNLTNSTVSSNRAVNFGGGGILSVTVAGGQSANLSLTSSTVYKNSAGTDSSGIYHGGNSTATLKNTIVAGDLAGTNPDVGGATFVSQGYNLIGIVGDASGFNSAGDLIGTAAAPLDPRLGPLQINGGPTPTHALQKLSPAIDKGNSFGLTTDQRGLPRPVDKGSYSNAADGSDIGAFERSQQPELFLAGKHPGGGFQLIFAGDTSPSTTDHTDFQTAVVTANGVTGTSVLQEFLFANFGDSNVVLGGNPAVRITGAGAAAFSFVGTPPTTIAAGNSVTAFQIKFQPATAGVQQAQVEVSSNDPDNPVYVFAIQGVGVVPTNAAPTISEIPDQRIRQGLATPAIPFTIADADTALANLTVTRRTSDANLVPLNNIALGGSGANRTVTVTPVAGRFGTVEICIDVSDGTTTTTESFILTVTPEFTFPIGGVPYVDWSIVNYVDLDPSGGVRDYRGGTYSYNGHDALDITLANFAAMDRGIPVLAAAAGTVIGVTDGKFDRITTGCGDGANVVTIDHGQGWITNYYHLRRGSLQVSVGQQVTAGQQLALVGSSGCSTDAHLHWSVYYNGQVVETFVRPQDHWASPLTYSGDVPGVLDGGTTNYDPNPHLKERPSETDTLNQASGQTIYSWALLHGIKPADTLKYQWYKPNGSLHREETFTNLEIHYGWWTRAFTLPTTPDAGTWKFEVRNNGTLLWQDTFAVTIAGAPEIRVGQSSTYVLDGRTTPIDFGSGDTGQGGRELTFTVTNHGSNSLTTANLTVPAGYLVTEGLSASIAAGQSDNFTVRLEDFVPGTKAGQIRFTTNDADEQDFNFAVEGRMSGADINAPPTLNPIPNPAAVNEDAGLQTVDLANITAGGGANQPLQVTVSSNNTGLIPAPTVSYTSPNATGSLTYTPVANASGTAVITVTVTDGGLDGNLATTADNGTFSRSFTVTVNAVNDAPTLNAIADPAAINEDAGQQTLNLAGIGPGPLESQPLQVTVSSSNTGLIPAPTVSYTSPNATGTLTFTPQPDRSGTAVITVTVTDGGLDGNLATTGDNAIFNRSFTVTVNPVNDAPTLNAIADPAAINEDAGQQTVNLAGIGPGPLESQPLQVTVSSSNTGLIPASTVSYTSPNATGTLTFTPQPDRSGTAVITVTVTDGGLDGNLATTADNGTFSRSFTVTVNPFNDAPNAADDSPSTNVNAPVTVDVLANDADVDGDTLALDSFTQPGHGVVTRFDNGTAVNKSDDKLIYTPSSGFSGSDSFSYTVSDGQGGTDTATVAVVVATPRPTQTVRGTAPSVTAPAGQVASFSVAYVTSDNDNTLAGLGFRLHFDSSKLSFRDHTGVLATNLITAGSPVTDSNNLDGDTATDRFVEFRWSDILNSNWPNATLPATLLTANFTVAAGLQLGATSSIRFSPIETAPGYDFVGDAIPFVVGSPCNLNADGNAETKALSDGILIFRYLFGIEGAALTNGVVGPGATRTTPAQIDGYLDGIREQLDADGDGEQKALSDGILIFRYLFGIRGAELTRGAVSPGATRNTADAIATYLDACVPAGASGAVAGAATDGGEGEALLQMVSTNPSQRTIGGGGENVSFAVNYNTDPANSALAGIGFRLHFNSNKLEFQNLTNLFSTNLITNGTLVSDTADLDQDAATDKRLEFRWSDIFNSNWPGGSLPQLLFNANFRPAAGFTSGSSNVNFSKIETAPGYVFQGTGLQVSVQAPSAPTVTDVTALPTTIAEAQVGAGTFAATVTFDQPMQTTSNPTLTLNPGHQNTLANGTGQWTNSTTFVMTYDVVDQNVTLTDIAIDVTGATSAAGVAQADYTPQAEFSIDTIRPAVTVNPLTTNDTTPLLTGTVSDGSLTVTVNGKTYSAGDGKLTVDGTNWSLQIPNADALATETYSVVASATDAAGNIGVDGTNNELKVEAVRPGEDLIEASVRFADANGNPLAAGAGVTIGQAFRIYVYAQDLRTIGTDKGVLSFFGDLSFNTALIDVTRIVSVFNDFTTGANNEAAGVVEEVGGLKNSPPSNRDPQVVFYLEATAVAAGTLRITTDAGEDALSENTLFGLDGDQRTRTRYGSAEISIGRPDLIGTVLNAVPDHVLGGLTAATVEIKNIGDSPAGAFEGRFVLSDDAIIGNADDVTITTIAFSGLAAGASSGRTVMLDLPRATLFAWALRDDPKPTGTNVASHDSAFLGLIIDPANAIAESNEANNLNRGKGLDSDDITYFPWDVNGSGAVTPTDVASLISRLGQHAPPLEAKYDLNGDGLVTPSEVVATINRLGYLRNASVIEAAAGAASSAGSAGGAAAFGPQLDSSSTAGSEGEGDNLIDVTIGFTNLVGQPLTRVAPGENFRIVVFAQDLRTTGDDVGVLSAFADLAFDTDLIDVTALVPLFDDFPTGTIDDVAGVIDEVGGLENSPPADRLPQPVFYLEATAIEAGLLNVTSAAGDSPFSENTLFGLDGDLRGQTMYGQGQLRIAAPQSPWQNAHDPFDVDDSGGVFVQDVAILVNFLNAYGAGPLPAPVRNALAPPPFVDVSGDNAASALDVIVLVNELNARAAAVAAAQASGSGEGEAFDFGQPLAHLAGPASPAARRQASAETDIPWVAANSPSRASAAATAFGLTQRATTAAVDAAISGLEFADECSPDLDWAALAGDVAAHWTSR